MHHLLGCVEQRHRTIELLVQSACAGEAPLRAGGGMTLGVIDRMVLEPLHGRFGQHLEAQGVHGARGHLEDLWLGHRSTGGHGDDRRRNHVDRDDVDHALWVAREGVELSLRERHEERLRHAEAADPARRGLGEGGFDDGWAHDGDRHVASQFHQGLLAERLGVRVDVRPSQRGGSAAARGDHLGVHPLLGAAVRSWRRAAAGQRRRAHLWRCDGSDAGGPECDWTRRGRHGCAGLQTLPRASPRPARMACRPGRPRPQSPAGSRRRNTSTPR